MAATLKRHVESKYVSVFADSVADTDITFRDDLLESPAENYQVGVDHLVLNTGSFSMFPDGDNVVVEVLRLHKVVGDVPAVAITPSAFPVAYRVGVVGAAGDAQRRAYQIRSDRPFVSTMQFMYALERVADQVTDDLNNAAHTNITTLHWPFTYNVVDKHTHLKFVLQPSGRIAVEGTNAFWSNYCIHVPEVHFRQVFFGDSSKFLMITNPLTGADAPGAIEFTVNNTLAQTQIGTANFAAGEWDTGDANAFPGDDKFFKRTVQMPENVLCSLDRRVCVEVGTSLPIKGSPLVDHEVSSSDFILARYFFDQAPINFSNETKKFQEDANGVHRYADERIQYHQLKPQQKISQLRLKIWARVRRFDTLAQHNRGWVQDTIAFPVTQTDFWACRLHFVAKE